MLSGPPQSRAARVRPLVGRSQGPPGLGTSLMRVGQGLTLVHFSAQPEPFLSLKYTETTQRVPQKVLTSSRKVDEFKPLVLGNFPHTFAHAGKWSRDLFDTMFTEAPRKTNQYLRDPGYIAEAGPCRQYFTQLAL